MSKRYREQNVYDAAQERLAYIFAHFERVYVSFSGGKDSGVLLNLTLDYMRDHGITRKLGVMILDNEANYKDTTAFMRRMIDQHRERLEVYWCCLPITLPCTVSAYERDWQCWGEHDRHRWIQPLPEGHGVITLANHPFPFFRENMRYDEFWDQFGAWYGQGQSTACLIGIRANESLNRFRAIMNERKDTHGGQKWTRRKIADVFNCYPIYDWTTEDIWVANARFGWDYNKLYDMFHLAGLSVHQMRVASPFMSESKSSLALYKTIDPTAWARLCCRVSGANFMGTYGKQLDYKKVTLPPGHTWKSFTKFLLSTLPPETADNYRRRFVQSLRFWGRTGRGVPDHIIVELERLGIPHTINGTTPHGSKTLRRVVIKQTPDELDALPCHNRDVASWKRLALTILRNDHTCKYLGLQPTKEQMQRQKEILRKYACL